MKICPTCSTNYPDDANFCPMDAAKLVDKPAAIVGSPATTLKDGARSIAGRFLLGELVSNTPTGDLHRATDGQTSEAVWIKLIDLKALPTAMMADRALREYKQLAKLKSDRIARVIDQGRLDDGRVFVVTEAIAGSTLESLIEHDGALSFERAKAIVAAVGEALTEAQKVGVIHRDVAPRNVYLVGDKVKMTEFGVAEPVSDRVYGSPAFLSPEQAEGKPVDQRSNIYSLGALFYYTLTGAPPFEGKSDELIQQHLHTTAKPPSTKRAGITGDVDKLVLKSLEKSGGRRHLTLRQLLNELDGLTPPSSMAQMTPRSRPMSDESGRAATLLDIGTAGADSLNAATVQSMPAMEQQGYSNDRPASGTIAGMPPVPTNGAGQNGSGSVGGQISSIVVEQVSQSSQVAPGKEAISAASMTRDAGPSNEVAVSASSMMKEAPRGESKASAKETPAPKIAPTPVKESNKPPAPASAPTVKMQQQPAPPAGKQSGSTPGKKGFRETAWFKKGELEEEFAKRAAENPEEAPAIAPEAVVDESSLTDDDKKRLSLRTGHTEAMPMVKVKNLPGERMSDAEMLAEVDGSKKWLVIAGVAIAVIAAAAAVYFLFLRA